MGEVAASDYETQLYREIFSSFDLDGNGFIDAEELQLGLLTKGSKRNRISIVRMIESVDANDDGVLDFEEFLALMGSEQIEMLFRREQEEEESPAVMTRRQSTGGLSAIYGQTPTPPESSERIETGLRELQDELDAIPAGGKEGWTRALSECPGLVDDAFRLMFLRCEVFNAPRAATRLVKYWDKRIQLFGDAKAFMPLSVDGALADDDVALSLGFLRITGEKDPSGRGILLMDFSVEDSSRYESSSLVGAVWYIVHATLEDEEVQKKGVVILVKRSKYLAQWDVRAAKEMASSLKGALPFRLACFHLCHPLPSVNIVIKIGKLLLGKKLRSRIRIHSGSNEEVILALRMYGISREEIPNFWGGKLELPDYDEWLDGRRQEGL